MNANKKAVSRDKIKIVKLIIIAVFAILAVFLTELFSNLKVMRLSSDEKGITEYYSADIEPNSYVDKLIINYKADEAVYFTIDYSYVNQFGRLCEETITDKNNYYLTSSTVNIKKNVSELSVKAYNSFGEETEVTIKSLAVKNVAALNGFRMAFVFLACVCVGSLCLFYKFYARNLEYAFLIIGLCVGVMMVLAMPIVRVGWDEETHFMRVFLLDISGHVDYNSFVDDYVMNFSTNNPFEFSTTYEENRLMLDLVNSYSVADTGETFTRSSHHAGFSTFAYLLMPVTCMICKLFNMPLGTMIIMVRMTNMLTYLAIIFFAIRKLPKGKLIMAAVALMPTPMFLASTVSYDTIVTGGIYLGLAYLFAPVLEERPITIKEYLVFLFAVGIASMPKAVYIPVILLGLFVPHSCFTDKKTERLMKAGVILAFVAGMSTFVLPTLISPSTEGDLRGGDTSHAGQLSVILKAPMAYAGLLLSKLKETFYDYTLGTMSLNLMAYLGAGSSAYLTWAFFVFITATSENTSVIKDNSGSERNMGFRRYYRFILYGIVFCTIALIWTAMYMSFTELGVSDIAGVQGRYYIPFLFPVLFALSFNRITIAYNKQRYNLACLLVIAFIIFGAAWDLIISNIL